MPENTGLNRRKISQKGEKQSEKTVCRGICIAIASETVFPQQIP
jgi:hypothetical protein